jgi:hypothetical protein
MGQVTYQLNFDLLNEKIIQQRHHDSPDERSHGTQAV